MARHSTPDVAGGLTDRELDVLQLASRGFNLTESAARIGISKWTATDAMHRLMKKLDASTQAEAVYRAVKEGIIQ